MHFNKELSHGAIKQGSENDAVNDDNVNKTVVEISFINELRVIGSEQRRAISNEPVMVVGDAPRG